ncbi:MAG: transposase, partial [Clostridiaceae bacterium]|nr:transposase [Clostridiaceae bacterium]
DPFTRAVKDEDLPQKEKNKRDYTWKIISFIIDKISKPKVFITDERVKLLSEVTAEFNISRNTVDNYLKRFWKRGQVKNALLTDYFRCGSPGMERKSLEKKRGRPKLLATSLDDYGINVDDNIRRIFRVAINKYYNTTKKNPLTTVYELMIRDFFTEKFKDDAGNESILIAEHSQIPTIQQFRYWFNKERNMKKEITKRYSIKEYELNSRALIGKTRSDGLYPTAKYQIDATIADVYLVSRFNRKWIIGRPVVYCLVDTFSSMVVGINVTLEGPSFAGAMGALANAFMNKKEFCNEYDIKIEEDEWPVGYIPDVLVCDRGELIGKGIETLISNLGVTVENTASFRGDMKALVERYFKTIHSRVKPFTPGFIDSDFQKRGGRDYRLDSKLDVYQFTQVIIHCVLQYNNNQVLSEYKRDTLMIKDSVEAIPIRLWNWGIKNKSGTLRKVDNNMVKLSLMPRERASITEQGIRFRGMYYSSKTALTERWFEKSRIRGYWKIEVAFDPRSANYIYIIFDNGKRYEKCTLLEHQSRYIDKTLDEIEYLLVQEKTDMKRNDTPVLQSKINLYSKIESIVENATIMTNREQKNIESNTSKLKGIRANREIEKLMNRNNDTFNLDEISNNKSSNIDSKNDIEYEVDDISVLRRKQNERRNK